MLSKLRTREAQAHVETAHLQVVSVLTGLNLRIEAQDLPISQEEANNMEAYWLAQLNIAATEINAARSILSQSGRRQP